LTRVRESIPADAAAAAAVLRRSIKELCHEDHRGQASILEPWLENKTAASVVAWIVSPDRFCATAADESGEIAGFGMLSREGEVILLYVSPDRVGGGAGRGLLETLECQARAWGLTELFLDSTLTAQGFYERYGYRGDGSCRDRPDGLHCLAMRKRLDD